MYFILYILNLLFIKTSLDRFKYFERLYFNHGQKTKNKVLPIKGIVDIQQVFFDGKDFKKEKNNKKSVKKRFQVHTL